MMTMRDGRNWRLAAWGGAATFLAIPAVAMLFNDEVRWTLSDFLVAGTILGGLALMFEALIRRGGTAYRAAAALTLGACLLLVWVNLAVGIVGEGDHPANFLFMAVVLIAGAGAAGAGLAAAGMARTMLLAGIVQALILPVVLTGSAGAQEAPNWPLAVSVLTALLTATWLSAAWLFRQAARAG